MASQSIHKRRSLSRPVLALFTGDINKARYEALRKEVGWEKDHAAGGIIHAACVDDAGRMHVADVWEIDSYKL